MVTPTLAHTQLVGGASDLWTRHASIHYPECFHTHIKEVAGNDPGMVAFYDGDVAYESLDLEAEDRGGAVTCLNPTGGGKSIQVIFPGTVMELCHRVNDRVRVGDWRSGWPWFRILLRQVTIVL